MSKYSIVFTSGIICYLLFGIYSQVFYLERTAFFDIAFHLFHLIREGGFQVQNYRYGAVISQIFPLIAYHLDFSLENIARIYSLAFVILNTSIFLTCILWIRSYKYALAILMLNVFLTTHTFYWIQSEFLQGLPLIILYFAILDKYQSTLFSKEYLLPTLGMSLFVFSLNFFHPLGVFPFIFCVAYFFIAKKIRRKPLVISTILYVIFFFFKSQQLKTSYDSRAQKTLFENLHRIGDILGFESTKRFFDYVLHDYYLLVLGLLGIIIYYFLNKKFIRLILVLGFFVGYISMVNLNYFWGGEQFYMENQYMTLCVIVSLPLIFEMVPKIQSNGLFAVLIAVFLTIRLLSIYNTHTYYTDRLYYVNDFLDQTKNYKYKKLIVNTALVDREKLMMTWASPYEFWFLSSLNKGQSRSVMFHDNPQSYLETKTANNIFLTPFNAWNYKDLNPPYFNFNDTSIYHIVIEHEDYEKLY